MMAHFAKYKWHEYVGLVRNDRTKHDRDVQHPERAKENYHILGVRLLEDNKRRFAVIHNWEDTEKVLGAVQSNKERALGGVKVLKRKDINHVVSMVFTCPEDVKPEDERKCLDAAVRFMLCYKPFGGSKNLIMASFHFDEEHSHVTYDFCPVTDDGRLCAKDVLTKKVLQRFHSDMNVYIDKALGYHVSVENGKTKTGNKSINRLKEESYRDEIRKLKAQVKDLKSQVRYFRNGMDKGEAFMNAAGRLGVRGKVQSAVVDDDFPGEAVLNTRYDMYHGQRVEAGKRRAVVKAPAERGGC